MAATIDAHTAAQQRAVHRLAHALEQQRRRQWLHAFAGALRRSQRHAGSGGAVAVTRPGEAAADQDKFRGLALYCRGTTPDRVELPFLPEEVGRDGLSDSWDSVQRPGRDPLLFRAGGSSETLHFAVEVAHQSGEDLSVGGLIDLVQQMAGASTPVVVSLSRRKWMAMRITGMSVTETEHLRSGEPKRATLDLEFTRETTVAAAPGPVKISKRKEKKIKSDQAAKRKERHAANKRDNEHGKQADLPKGPSRHQTPEQAKAWARAYIQQKYPAHWQEHWAAVDFIFTHESGWRWNARNPSSGSYGIPQSLPANKMASAGSDWQDNAYTQIKWGINYMVERYGSPAAAKRFWDSHNWY